MMLLMVVVIVLLMVLVLVLTRNLLRYKFGQAFIATRTEGFAEYAESLEDKTPEWAEAITKLRKVLLASELEEVVAVLDGGGDEDLLPPDDRRRSRRRE